ncbi:Uncharacterized protein TCM_012357 [Theobroma cacao]|uniref:Transmembrane protein n=1 Tax=Theobroma cacao TaxID=3641 RepID=A0A061G1X0_THECC|nr:Uncharacterized protein TCM_012357 [Theobroma cacao]
MDSTFRTLFWCCAFAFDFKVLDECFLCSEGVFAADFVAIIVAGCSWSLTFMFGCVFQALLVLSIPPVLSLFKSNFSIVMRKCLSYVGLFKAYIIAVAWVVPSFHAPVLGVCTLFFYSWLWCRQFLILVFELGGHLFVVAIRVVHKS